MVKDVVEATAWSVQRLTLFQSTSSQQGPAVNSTERYALVADEEEASNGGTSK